MDLSTTYLGLPLHSPLVASASPISKYPDRVKQLEEAGIAAVVMYSFFEEQAIHESLELDYFLNRGTESFAESLSYLPDVGNYSIGSEVYLNNLHQLKQAVSIPVIASLNGITPGGWIHHARELEQAGADALELNIYNLPTDLDMTASDLEDQYIALVEQVRAEVKLPIAVKISPFFTALPNFVQRLAASGVQGVVLFNRFYQPDFDLELLDVRPHLVLSSSHDVRMPLRWVALLYERVAIDFALSSGVHTVEDVLKAMMAGARVSMMASALLQHGAPRVNELLTGLVAWMEEYEYHSIKQMQGSLSQVALGSPAGLERANYIRELASFDEVSFNRRVPGYREP